MLVLFGANVAYCIYMIMIEMRKRKKMLELMTGGDMLPYVRYARASVFSLFLSALTMPFAILSTTLLYIIGPLALFSILFFNLSFVALGYNYVPTEELLDEEAERIVAQRYAETRNGGYLQKPLLKPKHRLTRQQKTMMRQFPEYSNDIISAECGFSSRTYLYKIFKEKTGNTPTEWRTGVQTS